MTDKKLKARVKNVKNEFNGFLKINRYEIEADMHEGGTQTYERLVMERGHAVAILAYDPVRDEVVLVNEMRPGILAAGEYPYTDNLPAGGIAQGETPVEAAVRETKEEAGLDLKDARVIQDAYVSSGGTSEKIAIVFGIVDTSGGSGVYGNEDESEDIKTRMVKSRDFIDDIRAGKINDMKTIIAGYWLSENKDELIKKNDPCPKLMQDVIDLLDKKDTAENIHKAVEAYGKAYEQRQSILFKLGDDFRDRLPELYLKHGRYELFLDLLKPGADINRDWNYWCRGLDKLSDALLLPLVNNPPYGEEKANAFLGELSKRSEEYKTKFLDDMRKKIMTGTPGDIQDHEIERRSRLIRHIVTVLGMESIIDTWLDQARHGVEYAKKYPRSYYDDSNGYHQTYATLPLAEKNLATIKRIKDGVNPPAVTRAKPPNGRNPRHK